MEVLFKCLLFLCYVHSTVAATTVATFVCPANLQHDSYSRLYGHHCYHFTVDHRGDWQHAEADCRNNGGWLVDIHSYSEQMFIYNTLKTLGLHDKGVWIGFNDRDSEGTWVWTSGTNVNYKHWASGQPGLLGFTEDCALFEVSTGYWHDYACHGILGSLGLQSHGWVCKFAAVPVSSSMTTEAAISTQSLVVTSSEVSASAATTLSPEATNGPKSTAVETATMVAGTTMAAETAAPVTPVMMTVQIVENSMETTSAPTNSGSTSKK